MIFLIALLGLFIGSFLNLVSDRLQRQETIIWGKSKCEFCNKELKLINLLPLISFILQKGRCANCGHNLTFYYPLSEILTSAIFVLLAIWLKINFNSDYKTLLIFVFYALVWSFMTIILLSDLKFMVVPDKIVFPAILFVILSQLFAIGFYAYNLHQELLKDSFGKYLVEAGFVVSKTTVVAANYGYGLLCATLISLSFLFLIFITRGRGMGGGDVKLGFLIGLINGFPNGVIAIFLGFLTGAVYSVILVLLKRKSVKDVIPFGPFLIFGSFMSLIFGTQILEWYIHLL